MDLTRPHGEHDHVNQSSDEELVDVPEAEKLADPLWYAKIKRTVDGKEFRGQVVEIERGAQSKETLYRVVYEDEDIEHMVAEDLYKYLVNEAIVNNLAKDADPVKRPAGKHADKKDAEETDAIDDGAEDDAAEDDADELMEDEDMGISKKPASDLPIVKRPAAAVSTETQESQPVEKAATEASTKAKVKAESKAKAESKVKVSEKKKVVPAKPKVPAKASAKKGGAKAKPQIKAKATKKQVSKSASKIKEKAKSKPAAKTAKSKSKAKGKK